jgi:addiction module HigA family antidote
MNRAPLINPIPEIIAELIEASGRSKTEVASALGIPATRISELLAGQLRVNAELALRLSRVWPDSDPSYWLGIQNEVDLRQVREEKAAALRGLKRLRPVKRAG